ncbi:unnamed protein product [Dovyalis caffra]|uniref:Secreted peptide n=1 Tax=Dovyalis caffra TaxID=77055 RepID=A0AAV1SU07_9ROSI|nr:unnamed protein product [Dovyalis caffra]
MLFPLWLLRLGHSYSSSAPMRLCLVGVLLLRIGVFLALRCDLSLRSLRLGRSCFRPPLRTSSYSSSGPPTMLVADTWAIGFGFAMLMLFCCGCS